MAVDNEMSKSIGAIFKQVFKNPGIHRNVLLKELQKTGKISSKEKFNSILESLTTVGSLHIDNRQLITIDPSILSFGVLQKNGDDYFIVVPGKTQHIPVERSVAAGYKPGDILDVVLMYGKKGKQIAHVIGRSNQEIHSKVKAKKEPQHKFYNAGVVEKGVLLGRVVKLSHDDLVFIPNKKSIEPRQIPILNNREEWAAFQDKLCLMKLTDIDNPIMGGQIIDVKGDAGNPIHEYDAIAESYGAIMSWTGENIEAEIEQIPTKVDVSELKLITEEQAPAMQRGHTVDLRHIPFVTVDPATCKDMDDAIYSRFNEDGDIECYIAVACVPKYVDLSSEIGQRYALGEFTIYAPNKAYNVLPSKLSTGICSLNPDEDRRSFVVKAVIDRKTGNVKSSNIYDALIKSRHKYSYEEAQEITDVLSGGEGYKEYLEYKGMVGEPYDENEQILMNYYAAQLIMGGFNNRKMIRFVSNKERDIVFDRDLDDVVDIKPVPHLAYHEVIEAFMITANEVTAKYAKDNGIDNIYRVHEEPSDKKVARAGEFFDILGIEFDGDLTASGTRALVELTKGTPYEEVANNFLIKMQSRAKYSNKLYGDTNDEKIEDFEWIGERISHFALQSPHYSHTTSPIRRAPDYVTQYNILAHMHGTKPLSHETVEFIIEQANERQLDVDQAEKDFADISSVLYCEKHIGETMHGRITKFRYTSPEEGYEDDILVIAKNEEKGVSVEIPLSQIIGRRVDDCVISEQCCAVFNGRGDTILTLCKPIDFIITKADRRLMTITGKPCRKYGRDAKTVENTRNNSQAVNYIKKKNKRMKRYHEKQSRPDERAERREHLDSKEK